MFNKNLTTDVVGEPEGATLKYQWQKQQDDGTWENISDATAGQYTPTTDDVEKQIRVVVSADEYSGCIIGAAKTVERASQTAPGKPQLATSSPYTSFTITPSTGDTNLEYVWTIDSTADPGTLTPSKETSVTGCTANGTYYVYARKAATTTHNASPWSEAAVIKLAAMEDLFMVSLKDSSNNVYLGKNLSGDEKVYIQKDTDAEFTVIKNPEAATTWEAFTFKSLNSGDNEKLTVTNSSVEANDGTGTNTIPEKITIKGTEVGVYTLGAYKGSNDAYGSWKIVVYDTETVATTPVDSISYTRPELNDITLNVGDTYTIEFDIAQLNVRPSGALNGRLAWKVPTGGAGAYDGANDYLSISYDNTTGKYTVKALEKTEGAADGLCEVCLVADNRTFASFNVTVTADTSATSPDSVAPHTHTYSTYTDNGNGTHTATCTVEGCGAKMMEVHSWSAWSTTEEANHTRTCSKCGAGESGTHSYVWVIDTPATIGAAGKKHEECSVCGKTKSENTSITALTPVDKVVVSVAAPAHNGTAQNAAVKEGTGYTVANTVFYAPDGTAVMPGGKFAANTQYTAYVTLEAKVDEGYVFAMNKGKTNVVYKINDKQYSGETPAYSLFAYTDYEGSGDETVEVTRFADSRDTITLTYEFQPTGQNSYYYHGGTTTTGGTKNSAATADPGVLLYGVMALSSYTGTALLVRGRKKHD